LTLAGYPHERTHERIDFLAIAVYSRAAHEILPAAGTRDESNFFGLFSPMPISTFTAHAFPHSRLSNFVITAMHV